MGRSGSCLEGAEQKHSFVVNQPNTIALLFDDHDVSIEKALSITRQVLRHE